MPASLLRAVLAVLLALSRLRRWGIGPAVAAPFAGDVVVQSFGPQLLG